MACHRTPSGSKVAKDEAARLLFNRNWLDRMPKNERGQFYVYRFIPEFNRSGVFQDRTLYAGHFELFFFKVNDDELAFDMPHGRTKLTTRYTIERIDPGERPPFDLRLRLARSPRGPKVYYGTTQEGAVVGLDASKTGSAVGSEGARQNERLERSLERLIGAATR